MIATGSARRSLASPPQHCANAGHEFARIERFGEIVVCADLEPQNAIHRLATGGEQEDRNCGLMTQSLEQLESRAAR